MRLPVSVRLCRAEGEAGVYESAARQRTQRVFWAHWCVEDPLRYTSTGCATMGQPRACRSSLWRIRSGLRRLSATCTGHTARFVSCLFPVRHSAGRLAKRTRAGRGHSRQAGRRVLLGHRDAQGGHPRRGDATHVVHQPGAEASAGQKLGRLPSRNTTYIMRTSCGLSRRD